jgi:hypothetical protein
MLGALPILLCHHGVVQWAYLGLGNRKSPSMIKNSCPSEIKKEDNPNSTVERYPIKTLLDEC